MANRGGALRGSGGGGEDSSLSIEETNRIRQELGLTPLVVADPAADAAVNQQREEAARAAGKERETEELRQELKHRKTVRTINEKMASDASLGDILKGATGGGAADWVNRSRKLDKQSKLAARRAYLLQKQDEELQEYDSENLTGLTVKHELGRFEEGQTHILTLKDQNILASKDGELQDTMEGDELESSDLVQLEVAEKNNELKKKKKRYDVYSEEAELLAQYNEEKPKEGFKLEVGGEVDVKEAEKLKTIREKLNKPDDDFKLNRTLYDLSVERTVPSDYLPVGFKKSKEGKKKKVKKTRKPTEVDPDETAEIKGLAAPQTTAPAASKGLKEEDGDDEGELKAEGPPPPTKKAPGDLKVNGSSVQDHMQDHGSRSAVQQRIAAEQQKMKDLKDASYLKAINKAERDTRRAFMDLEHVFEEDQDQELFSSLDKARRAAQKVKKTAEELAKDLATEIKAKREAEKAYLDAERRRRDAEVPGAPSSAMIDDGQSLQDLQFSAAPADENLASDDVKKEGIVFTATTEFCRGLQEAEIREPIEDVTKRKQRRRAGGTATSTPLSTSSSGLISPSELSNRREGDKKESEKRESEKKHAEMEQEPTKMEDDEDEDEDAEETNKYIEDEPLANGSVRAALDLAKKRGLLMTEKDARGRIKNPLLNPDEDQVSGIMIQHLNKYGKPMTAKEAFRELSHVFHGRAPGPVKLEKKHRRFKEEMKRLGSRDDNVATLERLREKQQKTGSAFVVLDRDFAKPLGGKGKKTSVVVGPPTVEPPEQPTANERGGFVPAAPVTTASSSSSSRGVIPGKTKVAFDIGSKKREEKEKSSAANSRLNPISIDLDDE